MGRPVQLRQRWALGFLARLNRRHQQLCYHHLRADAWIDLQEEQGRQPAVAFSDPKCVWEEEDHPLISPREETEPLLSLFSHRHTPCYCGECAWGHGPPGPGS